MIVYPAIDLSGGRCVRLKQGDFAQCTVFRDDPVQAAVEFADAGAQALHVVDLDGARDPATRQVGVVERIVRATRLRVQVGGGIRTAEDVAALIAAGASRVILGSVAVRDPDAGIAMTSRFGPDRIVFGLDVRMSDGGAPLLATHGWRDTERRTLWDAMALLVPAGLRTLLCTDISRDGMLSGPNLALYGGIARRFPGVEILASGGIASLADLTAIRAAGLAGAVVGRALYEGRFTLAEALEC